MDRDIMERLEILLESGQITKQDMEKTVLAVDIVEKKFGIKVENEVGGMFVTHLAKALTRIAAGEGIEETTPEVEAAVKGNQELVSESLSLFEKILGTRDIPEGEVNFIAMYLNLLLKT
jgi:transcriptional regulatory protein LevR